MIIEALWCTCAFAGVVAILSVFWMTNETPGGTHH